MYVSFAYSSWKVLCKALWYFYPQKHFDSIFNSLLGSLPYSFRSGYWVYIASLFIQLIICIISLPSLIVVLSVSDIIQCVEQDMESRTCSRNASPTLRRSMPWKSVELPFHFHKRFIVHPRPWALETMRPTMLNLEPAIQMMVSAQDCFSQCEILDVDEQSNHGSHCPYMSLCIGQLDCPQFQFKKMENLYFIMYTICVEDWTNRGWRITHMY